MEIAPANGWSWIRCCACHLNILACLWSLPIQTSDLFFKEKVVVLLACLDRGGGVYLRSRFFPDNGWSLDPEILIRARCKQNVTWIRTCSYYIDAFSLQFFRDLLSFIGRQSSKLGIPRVPILFMKTGEVTWRQKEKSGEDSEGGIVGEGKVKGERVKRGGGRRRIVKGNYEVTNLDKFESKKVEFHLQWRVRWCSSHQSIGVATFLHPWWLSTKICMWGSMMGIEVEFQWIQWWRIRFHDPGPTDGCCLRHLSLPCLRSVFLGTNSAQFTTHTHKCHGGQKRILLLEAPCVVVI